MKQFRRYQERAVNNFKSWFPSASNKLATMVLPTGCGKTYSAVSAINCLYDSGEKPKVLWGAHRKELIEQAYDEFKEIIPSANIQIEMADERANADADIIVGSVQTLYRNRKNIRGFVPTLCVIDEWHHYDEKNKTYHGLFERYPEAKFLGLTATPYRFTGGDLPLGEKLIEMDIGAAVRHNYLVPPNPTILKTNISLADVHTRAGDFAIDELAKVINVDSRNELIAKRVIQAIREEKRQGILFAANVDHAKALFNLIKNEVRAGEVYGETGDDERDELMQRVRGGDVDVLINNLVATEGFNVPHMSFVCIARPTKSLGLYTQMLGRGLRLFEGKSDCLVIDVFDKIKTTQSRVTYSDLALAGDLDGNRKRTDAILKEKIADKLENFPVVIKLYEGGRWLVDNSTWFAPSWALAENQWVITWSKTQERIETDQKEYVPLKFLPPAHKFLTQPMQVKHRFWKNGTAINSNQYDRTVEVDFGKYGIKHIPFEELSKEETKYDMKKLDTPIKRAFFVCMSTVKDYGRLISLQKHGKEYKVIDDIKGDKTTLNEMIKVAAEQDDIVQIVKSDAQWRKRPASDKQKDLIKRYIQSGKISDDLDLNSLTGGDASVIMDQVTWHEPINQLFGAQTQKELIGYDAQWDDV